ncbi:hypothetical protein, partial [Xenorhabdus bovienii]|uniref:hypothetical protein n=1 Tax=Xenorhabdus bovienii TaxID=40576 RepID=UPI0023B28759
RGELKGASYLELTKYWGKKGFNLYFIDVMYNFISILTIVPIIVQQEFVHIINYHAVQAKIKDDTFNHLIRCIKQLGW